MPAIPYPPRSCKRLDFACERAVTFHDKLGIRAARWLDPQDESFLRANSVWFGGRRLPREHAVYHRGHGWSYRRYVIVAPNQRALDFLATLADETFYFNRLEPALGLLGQDFRTRWTLKRYFDKHFVQPWHNQQVKHYDNGGTVTGRRRFWFDWYVGRPCKVTHDPNCFKLEARLQGRDALRRHAGIKRNRDIASFDFVKFFQRKLDNFSKSIWKSWGSTTTTSAAEAAGALQSLHHTQQHGTPTPRAARPFTTAQP
jgi:hypothetical protein